MSSVFMHSAVSSNVLAFVAAVGIHRVSLSLYCWGQRVGPCLLMRTELWLQVELPLGATEDRICGTIDIEKALQEGVKAYEPGLLVRCIPGDVHLLVRA